jgi:hypothetical protein
MNALPLHFLLIEKRHGVVDMNSAAAASQNILERGRCNSNAPELASPVHLLQRAARFPLIEGERYLCARCGRLLIVRFELGDSDIGVREARYEFKVSAQRVHILRKLAEKNIVAALKL